jgi:hypothetical protein
LAAALTVPARADEQRVFTVAGGGSLAPRDGLSATQVRLVPAALTVTADGSIIVVDHGRLWAIGLDGRLRGITGPPGDATDLDGDPGGIGDVEATPDGALVAVVGGRVLRRPAGRSEGTPLFVPPPAVPPARADAQAERVAATTDGRIVVGGTYLSWVLDAAGHVLETIDDGGGEGVAALPGGDLALMTNYSGLTLRSPDGDLHDVGDFEGAQGDLLALPDGRVLVSYYGRLYTVDAQRRLRGYLPDGRLLGIGDGGVFDRAPLFPFALASTPDGGLVFADASAREARGRFVADAHWTRDGLVTIAGAYPFTRTSSALIRWTAVGPQPRPLLAVTGATFRTLARGAVTYRSTIVAAARLVVIGRDQDKVVDIRFTAAPGESRVPLPRRLHPGDYRIELTLDTPTATVTDRLAVSTRRRLDLSRARRVLRAEADDEGGGGDAGGGTFGSLGPCTRHGPLRLDCGVLVTAYGDAGSGPPRCQVILSARQRPDGMRIVRRRPRPGTHCRLPRSVTR